MIERRQLLVRAAAMAGAALMPGAWAPAVAATRIVDYPFTLGVASGEPAPDGSAAMYGMVGTIPDRKQVDEFLVEFLDGLFNRA